MPNQCCGCVRKPSGGGGLSVEVLLARQNRTYFSSLFSRFVVMLLQLQKKMDAWRCRGARSNSTGASTFVLEALFFFGVASWCCSVPCGGRCRRDVVFVYGDNHESDACCLTMVENSMYAVLDALPLVFRFLSRDFVGRA